MNAGAVDAPVWPPPVGRLARLRAWLTSAEFRRREREIDRLRRAPRHTAGETDLLGVPMRYTDCGALVSGYRQIFERDLYRFTPGRTAARVIDCGANVGLSVLYFKRLLPDARIVALEPDPAIFEVLSWNCRRWGFEDVELHRAAVWTETGAAEFSADGADAGRLVASGGALEGARPLEVPTVRLRDLLANEPIDFLKLDVEGAEGVLLRDCADRLGSIDHVFVEYHSFADREQDLDAILATLRAAGFRVHLQPELVARRPFVEHPTSGGMDQRLNVFAHRGARGGKLD